MAKKKQRVSQADRFASQAAASALLKYGPEESGLKELQQQAIDTYGTTVKQARGTGESTISAVDATRPQIDALYRGAGLDQARTATTLIGSDLAGLSGVANSIKAGAASEQAVALGNLQQARTGALTDLATRRVAAREGVQFAEQNAKNSLASDLQKVLTRKQELESEKGTYTALTAQQLQDAADKLATQTSIAQARLDQEDINNRRSTTQSERNSERSAGIDPNTGKPIPGGKADPKAQAKSNLQPSASQARAASQIQQIANTAHNLYARDPSRSRAKLVQLLAADVPAQTVDPKTGKPVAANTPGAVKVAGRKGATPDVLMTAALDQTLYGYLSPNTQKKLQAQGYSIKALGLTSYNTGRREKGTVTQRSTNPAQDALAAVVQAASDLNRRR